MSTRKATLIALAAAAALAAASVSASPASAATQKRRIPRTAPSWVAGARSLGDTPKGATSSFRIYLAPRGGLAALQADVAAVSDPSSSSYRHFVSAKQYHAKYDATAGSVARVSSFLRSHDLKVTSVEAHRRYLSVTGSTAAVEQAFAVAMKRFHHAGRTVQANTTAVAVPTTIAPLVSTVTGLDTTPHRMKHHATSPAPPPDGFRNARPCSKFYGQIPGSKQADKKPLPTFKGKTLPYAVCGYTGTQLRGAYEGRNPQGLNGAGTTVAITDAYAAPTIAKDAQKYAKRHGDGGYKAGQLTQTVPPKYTDQEDCGENGWYGEETLDVEAVHAMAPGAKIAYYASASCNDPDFLKTLAKVVDDDKASLVTNSWGDLDEVSSPSVTRAYNAIFLQGAMQGIGFLFSSGDNGDELEASGTKQTDYPASDPYVTAVGGTSDAIGSSNKFQFQTGWGTEKYVLSANGKSWVHADPFFFGGAGGGNSLLSKKPWYQKGVVPASSGSGRAVPDVGLDSDPTTGMLVGETQTFPDGVYYDEYRIGGTSLASPLFAGLTALRAQSAGKRLGFLNPSIYKNARSGVFTDIKGSPPDVGNVRADYANAVDTAEGLVYSFRAFNKDTSLKVKKGWDDVTGVGSPNSGWIKGSAH